MNSPESRPAERFPGPADVPDTPQSVGRAAGAHLDVAVRSAHVDTLGPQAVDVFYLQEAGAGVLSETRAADAAHAVRAALSGQGVDQGRAPGR